MREVRDLVSSIKESLDRIDLSKLKRLDIQTLSLFKEIVDSALEISEKISCIDETKNFGNVDHLCFKNLVLTKTSQGVVINKLGFGRVIHFDTRNRELKISSDKYEIRLTPTQILLRISEIQRTIDLRKIENISENNAIAVKIFSNVIEALNKTNEDLSRCIRIERIKC